MKKILNFIDTWGLRIVVVLTTVVFLKTCTTNSKIKTESDKVNVLNKKVDSVITVINQNSENLKKQIIIEGLKSEKRMIQSTDRKILDVNRQSEIDKELSKLEK